MRPPLLDAPRSRFTFVVGKGGTGKSTTASSLALAWADAGNPTHLISTDPAPSLADIFGLRDLAKPRASRCSDRLTLEELDARRVADDWIARVRAPLEQIVEQGTYLDATDVSRITHLTLPGIDELAAALRITELAHEDNTVVVDTAPTGHTLRLLDAADLIDSWANVFSAMADKVATIAMTMVNARVRLPGEEAVEQMRATAATFRDTLATAHFVVVTRGTDVVIAETERLLDELHKRHLCIAAVVVVHAHDRSFAGEDMSRVDALVEGDGGAAVIHVPGLATAIGCDGLRAWASAASGSARIPSDDGSAEPAARHVPSADTADARSWLTSHKQTLFWFAGKGGVGKSTCAAAAAVALSDDRDVLLCSTDPAGSLSEVLALSGQPHDDLVAPRLRAWQVDAAAQLDRWREQYRDEAERVFDSLGVGGTATMDRNIMTALWDAVPPGIDELFAMGEILDAAGTGQVVVVDAAPTGHFLRLIESPEIALEWTHAILRILLKYGVAAALEGFSERVLAFARQLKHLRSVMTDESMCGVVVVTQDEPIIRAQTARLMEDVAGAGMHVIAQVENRATSNGRTTAGIRAPQMAAPPAGVESLRNFIDRWQLA
jgi:arsenite-transporting ATPase